MNDAEPTPPNGDPFRPGNRADGRAIFEHVRIGFSRQRPPSLIARIAFALIALALFVIGLIILIPLALIALVVGILGASYLALRRAIAGSREPGGVLDARRNVRVITPDDERP